MKAGCGAEELRTGKRSGWSRGGGKAEHALFSLSEPRLPNSPAICYHTGVTRGIRARQESLSLGRKKLKLPVYHFKGICPVL